MRRRLLLLGLVAVLGWWALARPAPPRAFFAGRGFLRMAHQGGEDLWPSNTMLAFRESARLGVEVLDTDTHLTRDGVLVLLHDETVDRTTDGHGFVRDMTLAEVQRLDAGFHSRYRGQGLRIPTLEELLDAFPDRLIGLELKQTTPAAVVELDRVLTLHKARSRVLLSTFVSGLMAPLRKRCPDLATAATPEEVRIFWVLSSLHLESFLSPSYSALQVPLEHGGHSLVTARFVQAAHARGVRVLPWTLNTRAEIDYARSLGVDGINSNRPDLL